MGIATKLEAAIDLLLNNYVTSKSGALIGILTPVVLTCVTVYVLMMGYAIMRGEANDSLHTFLWKSFKIAFVAGIALSAGEYQGTAIQMIQGLQEGMTQAVGGVTSIGQLVDNMSQPYEELGQSLWSQATTGFWPNFSLIAAAALVAVAQAFLFVVGLGMYLLAKVVLALVLAVGPIFIVCAMFPATQKYTESWIGQCLHYVLLNVLIAASISMLTDFASQYANSMKGNVDTTNVIRDAVSLLLVSASLAVVMLNLNQLASALSGGVAIGGIGREIGRKLMDMLSRDKKPQPPQPPGGGGQISDAGGSGGGGSGGSGGSRSGNESGTGGSGGSGRPLYQRNVVSNIRRSSTQRG
ncbi:type IV secretion system protein [Variovorax sp. VaC1]|uniref:type IV secretion system protein n=1 Tax=Variovorax sp. VaC1 TaxID=3373132 RepID=UPI00374879EA